MQWVSKIPRNKVDAQNRTKISGWKTCMIVPKIIDQQFNRWIGLSRQSFSSEAAKNLPSKFSELNMKGMKINENWVSQPTFPPNFMIEFTWW